MCECVFVRVHTYACDLVNTGDSSIIVISTPIFCSKNR